MAAEEAEDKLAGTNMENYGSPEHRELRQQIAAGESAWDGVIEMEEGLRVWRIEKFKVVDWAEEDYGQFFDGDSFIILNAYKVEDAIKYNVHFWLGEDTSQDEAGVAAYKTVELDDLLGDLPVQFREVQNHESKDFLSLFPSMSVMKGGVDTGFRHVEPATYPPRLFLIKQLKGRRKKKKTVAREVTLGLEELNNSDVFVLDKGEKIYVLNTPEASVWEKRAANDFVGKVFTMRNGRLEKAFISWEDDSPHAEEFWEALGGKPEELPETCEFKQKKEAENELFANHVNQLYHVTDDNGEVTVSLVQEGELDRSILETENDDVVLVDVGRVIYVWLGASCSKIEKQEAMRYASEHLAASGRPLWTPVKRVVSGGEPEDFWKCFGCTTVPEDIC